MELHKAVLHPAWVAHASRVLVEASRLNGLSLAISFHISDKKVRERETHSPARGTRALPSARRESLVVKILQRLGLRVSLEFLPDDVRAAARELREAVRATGPVD